MSPISEKPKTALLIIDVQLGMFDPADPVHDGDTLLNRLQTLLAAARRSGLPVIFIQHNGQPGELIAPDAPGFAIHPAIEPRPDEVVVQKNHPDSFQGTQLHEILQQRGITHLLLTGIQTDACVDTTCRRAFSLDYDVTLVADVHSTWASGDLPAAAVIAHHNRILRWFADVVPMEDLPLLINELDS